jgi:hypothetical protein
VLLWVFVPSPKEAEAFHPQPLRVPSFRSAIVSVDPVESAVTQVVIPVTFNPVLTVPPTEQTRRRVAVRDPPAVGLAFTRTLQFPSGRRSLDPQASLTIEKSPGFDPARTGAEHPVAVAIPVFTK